LTWMQCCGSGMFIPDHCHCHSVKKLGFKKISFSKFLLCMCIWHTGHQLISTGYRGRYRKVVWFGSYLAGEGQLFVPQSENLPPGLPLWGGGGWTPITCL
jgi:hypothetical protein